MPWWGPATILAIYAGIGEDDREAAVPLPCTLYNCGNALVEHAEQGVSGRGQTLSVEWLSRIVISAHGGIPDVRWRW
ncbi:hypothetical protein GCM10009665_57720 [Kitasatospora nipponensis]|uniref:Uncharacterized protein n=1 Tax=Kitasatospora nipponensis TaxID=258049 RepID=A0ABN1WTM9_9ACTN